MKGIILAGGTGSRLYPATKSFSKQLIPVYDKPMVYYPLSVLMLADIRDILIISTPQDKQLFVKLFGDGSDLGLNIKIIEQKEPKGIADAFILAEEFIDNDYSCLILGDNIFYGAGFTGQLKEACNKKNKATIFGYKVKNPSDFGVVEIDSKSEPISIEEKPLSPKSDWAVPGIYFYDNKVVNYAKNVKPTVNGELSITSINQMYLDNKSLSVTKLGRGFSWFDTGNCDSLLDASNFVKSVEEKHGFKIACIEEIAYNNRWIDKKKLMKSISSMRPCKYKNYLAEIIKK